MKKAAHYAFIAILFLGCPGAKAMVVTDPTSYTYYVDQIKKLQEQQEQLSEQTMSLAEIKQLAIDSKKMATGSYNHAMKFLEYVKAIERGDWGAVPDTFEQVRQSIEFFCQSEINGKRIGDDGDPCKPRQSQPGGKDDQEYGVVEATEDILNITFGDPTSPHYNPWVVKNYKFAIEQMSRENTIKESQRILAKQTPRMERIEALAAEIDKTENPKSSADLTNRMLAEILLVQTEMVAVLTKMAEMQALEGYVGTPKNEPKEKAPNNKKDALLNYMREGADEGRSILGL